MAMDGYELQIVHDLKTNVSQFGDGTVNDSVSTEVNEFPEVLIYGVSLDITFLLWQDQANSTAFEFNPSTVTLWGRPLESGLDPTQLGQTVVVAPAASVTVNVAKDVIPASWASFEQINLLLDISGAKQVRVQQNITVIAPNLASSDGGITSGAYAIDTTTLTSETTITNVAGWRTYFLDSTGGAFNVHLPTPGSNAGQKLEFLHIAGGNSVNIDPGTYAIEGSTDDIVMANGDRYDLREFIPSVGNASWKNFDVNTLI